MVKSLEKLLGGVVAVSAVGMIVSGFSAIFGLDHLPCCFRDYYREEPPYTKCITSFGLYYGIKTKYESDQYCSFRSRDEMDELREEMQEYKVRIRVKKDEFRELQKKGLWYPMGGLAFFSFLGVACGTYKK